MRGEWGYGTMALSEPIDNLILRHVSGGSNEIYVARSQLAWPICVDSMKCCTDFSTCCLCRCLCLCRLGRVHFD